MGRGPDERAIGFDALLWVEPFSSLPEADLDA